METREGQSTIEFAHTRDGGRGDESLEASGMRTVEDELGCRMILPRPGRSKARAVPADERDSVTPGRRAEVLAADRIPY